METFYDDPKIIKEKIIQNKDKIKDQHPHEKYRRDHIHKSSSFKIFDFINLKVHQKSTGKILKLKTYLMLPDEKKFKEPKGIVFMFHGMGAYTGNTAHVAKIFCDLGIIAAGYDYRGHGFSEGLNGNIESMDEVFDDSEKFMDLTLGFLKEKYKENNSFIENKFLVGISMGGFMSYFMSYKRQSDFKGVIFFCPAVGLYDLNIALGLLAKISNSIFPNAKIPKSKKESLICKNPKYFEEPDQVILNTFIRVRTAMELKDKVPIITQTMKDYEVPFLIIIPGMDKLVPPISMIEFYEAAKAKEKEVWYY